MHSVILGICFLAALVASFLMSSLKACHSVCGLEALSFCGWLFISEHNCIPFTLMYLFSSLSCRRPRGHDHLSFPMIGEVIGARRTEIILWSVGIPDDLCDHSLRLSSRSSFA